MARLGLGESSSSVNPVLDITIRDVGQTPVDPATLEFVIYDFTTGVESQIFPAVAGTRQAITIADVPTGQRISTGRFFAPWTVPTTGINVGTHLIRWFFTEVGTGGAPVYTAEEEFEIFSSAVTSPAANFYTTIAAFRTRGITVAQADDATLTAAMTLAHALLERYTRQFFNPRTLEYALDGNNSQILFLPVPIISIEWLRPNDSTQNLDPAFYRVYNGREPPNDNRKNPMIAIERNDSDAIFRVPTIGPVTVFIKGRQNQRLRGVFGYTEADGSTPAPIIEAVERMTIERLSNPAVGLPTVQGNTPVSGALVMEKTDGHEYRLSANTTERPPGLDGISRDPFVRDVLRMYKAPKVIASTSHFRV